MKFFIRICALAIALASSAHALLQQDLSLVGTLNALKSGATFTAQSGSTFQINGSLAGTPTGGTLNLAALTLTLPAVVIGGTASFQPLDADLTAIATLATTSPGRSLLTATALTAAGLGLTNGAALDVFGANGPSFYLSRTNQTGSQIAATISDFTPAASAAAPVQSVAGRAGTVVLTKTDVGLPLVDNTPDATKPVSSAQSTAISNAQAAAIATAAGDATTKANNAQSAAISTASGDATAKANAAQAAAISTAATDATTKANSAQAAAIQRANHTGTQAAGTITGLAASATSDTTNAVNITTGTLPAVRLPAFTGDAISTAGTAALTLANTAVTAGTYGSATQSLTATVDAKGRLTALSTQTVMPAASSITGLGTLATQNGTFSGLSRTAEVWVDVAGSDGTGTVNRPDLPFATINAALTALTATGGVVRIGIGTFAAISGDNVTTALKSGVSFIGARRPTIKSDYTALEKGSIIRGPLLIDRDNISLENLGIDSGSAVCTAYYSGVAQDGLAFYNNGQVASPSSKPPRVGIRVRGVTILGQSATAAVHGMLLENLKDPQIADVHTALFTHGIVLKSVGGTLVNAITEGHSGEGFDFKNDSYAECRDVVVSNITIRSISANDTIGLRFQENRGAGSLSNISVTGLTCQGLSTDLIAMAVTAGGTMQNIAITNFTTDRLIPAMSIDSTVNAGSIALNGTAIAAFAPVATGRPAVRFDGTATIQLPTTSALILGGGDMTIVVTHSFSNAASGNEILFGGNNGGVDLYRDANGYVILDKSGQANASYSALPLNWTINRPYVSSIVRSGNAFTVYRDEMLVGATTFSGSFTAQIKALGSQPGGSFKMSGEIYGAWIYTRALSQVELGELRTLGRTRNQTGLVYAAAPAQSTAATLADASLNLLEAPITTGATLVPRPTRSGDTLVSSLAAASAVTLTTGISANVASLALPLGIWRVEGVAYYTQAATTTATAYAGAVTTTSATLPGNDAGGQGNAPGTGAVLVTGNPAPTVAAPPQIISSLGSTTAYLVAQSTFTASTQKVFGTLTATRVR